MSSADTNGSHSDPEEKKICAEAAIIGCGIIGSRIALELASLGMNVKVFDQGLRAEQIIFKLRALQDEYVLSMSSTTLSLQEKKDHFDAACSRVKGTKTLVEAVSDAALVSEAIVEDLDVKRAVIADIEDACPSDCLITTNSLTIPIAQLQEHAKRPLQVFGLRFLFPVLFIPYTELSRTVRHYASHGDDRQSASSQTEMDQATLLDDDRQSANSPSEMVDDDCQSANSPSEMDQSTVADDDRQSANSQSEVDQSTLVESCHVSKLRQLLHELGKTCFESEPLRLFDTLRNVLESRGEYRLRLSNTESLRHQNREARVRTSNNLGAFTKVDGCVICLDGPCEVLSVACGHKVLCRICAREMAIRRCPMCRVEINRHLGYVGS